MKYLRKLGLPGLLFVGVLALGTSPPGFAAGTASGTDVTNTATLSFSVGGVPQTDIPSNVTTFKVDNKVDVTVAETSGGYTNVTPSATQQVLQFTVTHAGNTAQDFALTATEQAGGADPFAGTDNFDVTPPAPSVFVESGATIGYQLAQDTAILIDELAAGVAPVNVTVYVVATIPAGRSDGDVAAIALTATAHDAGAAGLGALTTETVGADTPGAVDVVFADGAGDLDGARSGSHSDTDAYRVQSAQISVTKSSVVIRDPSNLGTNPKAIPGAWVQYTITIANAGTATQSATLTTISDALNANTAIDPDLIVGATGLPESALGNGFKVTHASARPVTAATQYFTTASDADGVEHAAGTVTATLATVLPVEAGYAAGELKPGESVSLIFNVVIQ